MRKIYIISNMRKIYIIFNGSLLILMYLMYLTKEKKRDMICYIIEEKIRLFEISTYIDKIFCDVSCSTLFLRDFPLS